MRILVIGGICGLGAAGDRDTWSVAIFLATGDQPLKNLRHHEQWMKAIRAGPLQAQWACTNPSAGRGLTVGFLHALRLRDAPREGREPTPR